MPIQVPAPVEDRVRRKWSRRARRIGYAAIASYVAVLLVQLFFFGHRVWFIWAWGAGLAAGARYLRAARLLEHDGSATGTIDPATRRLIGDYEEKIRLDGQREVAQGTLSMPGSSDRGELSIPRDSGNVSLPED